MRILAVRLRNLNSLAGSWAIDFTAPEYAASGIFAITGPTGAGKSTILDAICLALFARTPRLGHISKGSNEIMSRRAGDCFAEVEFETRQGRYRCHWGQHRARRSPEGDLQPPRHEMVDAASGKVLESRSREVGRLVEQTTGMDYDRFTRSILLAQGDFAAFLEADADQRAPILEQITGSSVYSRISMAVHERTSEERRKVGQLQEAMGNVALLDEEEEQALVTAINEGAASATGLQEQLTRIGQSLHRLAAIQSLKTQLATIDGQLLDLEQRRQLAGPDLARLDLGQRAQTLFAEYARLTQVQERIAALRVRGEELRAASDRMQQEHRQVAEEHVRACEQVQEAAALQGREHETIKIVRALDLHIHEKKKIIAQVSASQRQTGQEREQALLRRQEHAQAAAETAGRLHLVDAFLRDHAADGLLVEHLAGFRQQLQQLGTRENELVRLTQSHAHQQVARKEAASTVARLSQAEAQAAQAVAELQQRRQDAQAHIQNLLEGQPASFWRDRIEQGEQRLRRLEQAGELLTRRKALEEELAGLADGLAVLEETTRQHASALQVLEDKRQLQQQLAAQCERNHLLALRIRSYEEERGRLAEGDPCPLCGAIEHPWAVERPIAAGTDEPLAQAQAELARTQLLIAEQRESLVGLNKDSEHARRSIETGRLRLGEVAGQLTAMRELLGEDAGADSPAELLEARHKQGGETAALRQRIQAVEAAEGSLQAVAVILEQAAARHADVLRQAEAARHAGEAIELEMGRLAQQAEEERGLIAAGRADLLAQLQPLGIGECPPQQAGLLLSQLEARQQAWKAQQQQREELLRLQVQLQAEQDKADLLLAAIDTTLTRLATELEEARREEGRLRGERFELYGDRDPNLEEQKLKTLVQQAEKRELAVRTRLAVIDKTLHAQSEQLRVGAEETAILLPQSRDMEAALLSRLPAAGFDNLAAFCAALLPPETMAELDAIKQGLEQEQAVLVARRAEAQAALAREEEQRQGEQEQPELLIEQAARAQELETLQQRIGADRERLAVNRRHAIQFETQRLALAAQEKELERWELLHLLIGSADGKKFRVFAQGLTFEVMISHANRQLRKMSDRYILLRDPKEPLALLVIDNYQAGEIRSTRNLSGGESFLVSLALALGLSAMASHNVRVDSLFLDEGFGALDEEALDVALQTLAELQQDGKLIGVISHVPMLKDRIDLRIQVLPGPGGCSRLVGPGCAQCS
jgi:exonuclease SbcC